jgi:hypothetical protein
MIIWTNQKALKMRAFCNRLMFLESSLEIALAFAIAISAIDWSVGRRFERQFGDIDTAIRAF